MSMDRKTILSLVCAITLAVIGCYFVSVFFIGALVPLSTYQVIFWYTWKPTMIYGIAFLAIIPSVLMFGYSYDCHCKTKK